MQAVGRSSIVAQRSRRGRRLALGLTAASMLTGVLAAAGPAAAATTAEPTVRLLVRATPGASLPGDAVTVPSAGGDSLARIGWKTVEVPAGEADDVAGRLLGSGSATAVEAPQPVTAAKTPNDPAYLNTVRPQWEHTVTGTNRAWDLTTGSADVTIAVIDTGVNPSTELAGRLVPGHNVIDGTANTLDDHLTTHGTMAALTAAAAGNNAFGAAGVCWTCKIMPIKVLDATGGGNTDQSAAGIIWAVDHGADIVSLSLGGSAVSETQHDAVDYALDHGVPVIAAAGNQNLITPNYPAAFPGVVGVGATQIDDSKYGFSNLGPWVSLTAPGCTVAVPDDGLLHEFCGTSAATPYVAGVVALRMASGRFPGDTPATIRQALMETARRTNQVIAGTVVSSSGRVQTDAVLGGWGQYAPADPGTPPAAGNARYAPVTPSRVLDTREGKGAPVQRLGAGKSLHLQVAGAGGVPATGASAAVLNVTVTGATSPSYLTVYPHGSAKPTSSSLNFSAGDTVPNLVTTRLGGDGWVVIYNAGGDVDVIADVQGYYDDGSGAGNSNFTPLTPSRVLDTREPTGVATKAPVGANSSIDVQITGRGGVPASGVSAVALNVTVADATAGSYLTVWPTGVTRPLASNLNFAARQIIPNMVVVPVGSGGKVSLYNAVGSTNVIADVVGWYGTAASARFTPLTPVRALDTRGGFSHTGAIGADQSIQLQLGNARGVPANATGVVLNVTVTDPTAGSFVALWPSDVTRPTASNLNFPSRLTIANMVTARLSGDGKVSIYNALGSVNVIVDVVGYLV